MSSTSALTGRIVLITGASGGIGQALARRLAAEGARLALAYATGASAARALVESIRADGGDALAICADLSRRGAQGA